jgi:hypothetical protein
MAVDASCLSGSHRGRWLAKLQVRGQQRQTAQHPRTTAVSWWIWVDSEPTWRSGRVAWWPAPAPTPRPPRPRRDQGAACVQAGLGTLKSLALFQAATQQQIDYSTLANPTTGFSFTTLREGSYLSLGQVVKLHTTNLELFAWCR